MARVLPTALVMGVIVGLLVAAYMNIINVPVIEWAINLESRAAAGAADDGALPLDFLAGLAGQRIGLSVGLAVVGVLYAAVFTGLYHLARRATPGWSPWAWAAIAGLLGFWGVSMYTQIKFPLNPPGVGDEATLLARQGFQFLFIVVSTIAVAAVLYAAGIVNRTAAGAARWPRYAVIGIAYAVVALLLAYAIPGVRDPAPDWLPPELTIMFRSITAAGHFLLWMGIAFATVGFLRYRERGIHAYPPSATTAR